MRTTRHDRDGEHGQIVILFALSLVVLLAFGGLLYTGAQTLVLRRQLQNASDAAALAAANILVQQQGCSASGSGGAARGTIVAAARAAVTANIASYNPTDVDVSCPTGFNNAGVQVALRGTGPGYFGSRGMPAGASSTAVNGQTVEQDYAVVLLDPSNPSWRSQRNGCASFLVNGGITATFEKSIIVNSTCTIADSQNGAVKAINGSFSMSLINGAVMKLGGEYALNTAGRITPAPLQNYRPLLADPLSGIVSPDILVANGAASLPTVDMSSTGLGICRNQDPCILPPGTYPDGIQAANGSGPSTLLLRPGVFYLDGQGLGLKSGAARILSIPDAATMPDSVAKTAFAKTLSDGAVATAWQAACPVGGSKCGVMIYNAPSSPTAWQTGGGNADQVSNGAQGMLMLRSYNPVNDSIAGNGTAFSSYKNLVIWQARTPVPGPSSPQPDVSMVGGACVVVSGTVYAPGALVNFGGSTCGAGGGGDAVSTIQFIVWDLTLSGGNNFYFAYQRDYFAAPTAYGLVR
jgi:hypothetical protein